MSKNTSASSNNGREKGSAVSAGSRASISVKLPSPNVDEDLSRQSPVHVRSLSPSRQNSAGLQIGSRPTQTSAGLRGQSPGQRTYSPHSSGTVPPLGTPTNPLLSDKEVERILAARVIEKAWLSYRDRQMFKLLKHAICAAEHSLSHEILRKVSPQEAELLKDRCMQAKIRFRFAGWEFPPMIYFKVYTCNVNGFGVKYVSGKKMIQPASSAARDACDLMGHRKFYDQLIQDMMRHEEHKITDEVDVTTLKDYMQYLSLLDETPSYQGGRDNCWRKLTLEVLPRHTIFYDVVGYLYSRKMTPMLKSELPMLLTQPTTEDLQLQHIRIISQLRTPEPPHPTPKVKTPKTNQTGRRSRQAKVRAMKMRKIYEAEKLGIDPSTLDKEATFMTTGSDPNGGQEVRQYIDEDEEEEWEEEADKLYEWTQQLSLDEIVGTPRLGTAMTDQLGTVQY